MTSQTFIGIDVSKRSLEVCCHGDVEVHKFTNTSDGFARLAADLRELRPDLIALEATGGYERQAASHLSQAGFQVAVVNPTRVRRFAQG